MLLGVDIGTSAVKLSLVDGRGVEVGAATTPLSVSTPRPYWSEQNPDDWWRATMAAAAQLGARQDLSAVARIGLSGQMHGAVLLDQADRVIRPAILWNDGRCFKEAEELATLGWIGDLAGAPPLTGFTAPKLMWVRRHEPDAFARIAKILLPKDYVGFRMHGRHATDKSDAAGTLWFDQRRRDWSDRLAEASGVDAAWLPDCLEGVDVAGALRPDAAAALGLRAGTPVVAGGGDAATGAVSVGAVTDGAAFLSLGTSGQLFVATSAYRPNPKAVIHAYAHCVPGMWFQMAAMLNGARPLSWFSEIVGAPIDTLLKEARSVASREAPLFLPYLTGERTPHGDPHLRAAFHGLADGMTRAHMVRAVVDGIAFTFADAARALRDAGAPLSRVAAIGGGAASGLLLQAIADAAEFEVIRLPSATTGAAYGAALLAGGGPLVAAGDGPRAEEGDLFHPARDAALGERLQRFRQAAANQS